MRTPRPTVKPAIRMCALACALVVIAAPKDTLAQSGPIVAEVLKDWSDLKESTLRLANQMPADKYTYKPPFPVQVKGISVDTAQEHFGRRVLYIAQVNVRFLGILGGKAKAPVVDETEAMTSKDASMKAVADSFDYGIALLKEQTDQTILQRINASSIGIASRVRVFGYLDSHTRQIDGQLALYLLLSREVLPAAAR
jgi:hypothetical protein